MTTSEPCNNSNNNTHRRRKPTEAAPAATPPSNAVLLPPPSSQFMSAELEEMALLSSASSRTGMVAELESLKLQLIERDETIHRMTAERQQDHAQHMRTLTDETLSFKRELSFLEEALAHSKQERQLQDERYQQLEQAFEQFKLKGSEQDQQLRDEDAHHRRALEETVERLTAQISEVEEQHQLELHRLQQNHEELLETVVVKHAGALTDLSEQAKTDYDQRVVLLREELERQFRQDHQELLSKERVFQSRLEEQTRKSQQLQERLFELERGLETHEEERETWRQTNQSLERQLAMEHLRQQEDRYTIETVEKENRRLREILADLDLAAAASQGGHGSGDGEVEKVDRVKGTNNSNDNDNDNENGRPSKTEIAALYESQRRRWKDQTQLLERKMAQSEEEATAIMQKNMELMVALEMVQSLHTTK
ncbi:hypothetical protein BGZ68_002948 [Mortierella alpina]|nr:hypothetical protein BGZ68_002948 [Mortierella alpina]